VGPITITGLLGLPIIVSHHRFDLPTHFALSQTTGIVWRCLTLGCLGVGPTGTAYLLIWRGGSGDTNRVGGTIIGKNLAAAVPPQRPRRQGGPPALGGGFLPPVTVVAEHWWGAWWWQPYTAISLATRCGDDPFVAGITACDAVITTTRCYISDSIPVPVPITILFIMHAFNSFNIIGLHGVCASLAIYV